MKSKWSEPKIVEIPVKMTEEQVKSSGTGDSSFPGIALSDWHDCCCS